MQQTYLLLRDNRQLGPFTLQELLAQDLKPMDLIWTEGTGSCWQYPAELPALRAHQSPQDTQDPQPRQPNKTPDPSPVERHIYVSLPARWQTADLTAAAPSSPEQSESQQESFEARVARMKQRVAAYEQHASLPKNEDEPEIKYSRSLEDIKQEYTAWMRSQQGHPVRRRNARKPVLIAAIALVVTASGLLAAGLFRVALFAPARTDSNVQLESSNTATGKQKKPVRTNTGFQQAAIESEPGSDTALAGASTLMSTDSLALDSNRQEVTSLPLPREQASTQKNIPAPQRETPLTALPSTAEAVPEMPELKPPPVPLHRLLSLQATPVSDGGKVGLKRLDLVLRNNSRQHLKTVAVDVVFYRPNGQTAATRTLYFSDLAPGASQVQKAEGHHRAARFVYNLGLISTADGLYVQE